MNPFKSAALAAGAFGLIASSAFATPGNSASYPHASAGATIEAPLGITNPEGAGLEFGDLIAGTGPGTAVVPCNGGAETVTGDVTKDPSQEIPPHRASFLASGEPGEKIQLQITGSSLGVITLTGPGPSMTVDTLSVCSTSGGAYSGGPPTWIDFIPASGNDNFDVGGTLHVAGSQTAGDYSGTFTATITYI
jgi:hypothetical protein